MERVKIELGRARDIDGWMKLVEQVKDDFPGLETVEGMAEHRDTVLAFMARDSAVCVKDGGRVVGALLFSKENSMLSFLAVDPVYRRQHIAENMVNLMLTFMEPGRDIVVTTYREGVPAGIAARAFYKRLGFSEGKLTEEFGSPVQELILKR